MMVPRISSVATDDFIKTFDSPGESSSSFESVNTIVTNWHPILLTLPIFNLQHSSDLSEVCDSRGLLQTGFSMSAV